MSDKANIQGVLAAFSYGTISGSKRDPMITAEVIEQKHAESDAGSWSNKIFPAKTCGKVNAFTKLNKHLGAMRSFANNSTYVFEDKLWRILPEKRILTYKQVVEVDGKETFKELLETFIQELPTLVDLARIGRAEAFKESDYPTPEEIRDRYYYEVNYRPIPSSAGLNAEVMQEAIDKLNLLHQQRLQEANTTLIQRFMEPFKTLTEQLKNPNGRKIAPVIETIKELADSIPSLDLSGNQELLALASDVSATFSALKPEILRQDEELQKTLGQMADKTIAALQGFGQIAGGRRFA